MYFHKIPEEIFFILKPLCEPNQTPSHLCDVLKLQQFCLLWSVLHKSFSSSPFIPTNCEPSDSSPPPPNSSRNKAIGQRKCSFLKVSCSYFSKALLYSVAAEGNEWAVGGGGTFPLWVIYMLLLPPLESEVKDIMIELLEKKICGLRQREVWVQQSEFESGKGK